MPCRAAAGFRVQGSALPVFRCIESVLLVVAASTSTKGGASVANKDGHYRTFAGRVVGDLVAAFSDPLRMSALTLFLKHCQLNLPGLGANAIDYTGQAQGASLGSTSVMVTGMLRLVLALEHEHALADFWALLQPNADGQYDLCKLAGSRGRSGS